MKTHLSIRIAAFLAVIAMIATAGGCKKKGNDDSSSMDIEYVYIDASDTESVDSSSPDNSTVTSDKTSQVPSGSNNVNDSNKNKVVNNCYTTGTKIAKNPITFNIMVRDHGAGLAKYNDSSFAKYVKENMNITLKFQVCSDSNFREKMTLAYASNKMPDMYWGMAPANMFHNDYIEKKQVKEVGTYIDQYGANIKNMFKENPIAEYLATYDDGKMYMIPMVNNKQNYGQYLYINKNWLSKIGASVPKTTDELYNVLKKFKTEDANNNGNRNDEIPMMVMGEIDPSLYGPWGINTYWNGFTLDSSDKVFYAYTSNQYRNAMRYFNRLFKEGLLDGNLRGTTSTDIYSRTSGSVQTVGVIATSSYQSCISDDSLMKNYVVMPLLTVNGTTPQYYYNTYESAWAEWCVMTSACKYPECAVRLVDSFYSLEGTLLARLGAPGSDGVWNYDSNGKIVFNFNKMPSNMKTLSAWQYSRTPGYAIPHYASKEFYKIYNNAQSSQNKAEAYNQKQIDAIYSKVDTKHSLPKLYLSAAQSEKLNKLGDYGALRSDMFWQFLSGTASLDNDWDTYVSQMNKLGVTEATSVYQKAYNSYKSWLKNNS